MPQTVRRPRLLNSSAPPKGKVDATSIRIARTPPAGAAGSYPDIVISVSDGQASASLPPFSIDVVGPGNPFAMPATLPDVNVTWTAGNLGDLELFENSEDRGRRNTLIELLDRTRCALGARRLSRWVAYPLRRTPEGGLAVDELSTGRILDYAGPAAATQ